MTDRPLTFVTDFADQAVILPALAAIALVLLGGREWRMATAWLLTVGGVLGTVLVLKIACYACGWMVPAFAADRWHILSPSGHVASAAVVYAGVILLAAPPLRGVGRVARPVFGGLAAMAVAAGIGVTRYRLGAHSVSEVLIAAGVGCLGAMLFAGLTTPLRTDRARWSVVAALLVVWTLFHGLNLPAEVAIRNVLGDRLRDWIIACQPGA